MKLLTDKHEKKLKTQGGLGKVIKEAEETLTVFRFAAGIAFGFICLFFGIRNLTAPITYIPPFFSVLSIIVGVLLIVSAISALERK
jgi:hypothetical protein